MATDIMGLFADVNPMANYMKQQQAFQQNLSQAVTPQQFIATVGTNLGGQLGQAAQQAGLFGAQQDPQQQRATKRLEALQAAAASGVNQQDATAFTREVQKQLRARGLVAEAFALEKQALDEESTMWDIKKTKSQYTGSELGNILSANTLKDKIKKAAVDLQNAEQDVINKQQTYEQAKLLNPLKAQQAQVDLNKAQTALQQANAEFNVYQQQAPFLVAEAQNKALGSALDAQQATQESALRSIMAENPQGSPEYNSALNNYLALKSPSSLAPTKISYGVDREGIASAEFGGRSFNQLTQEEQQKVNTKVNANKIAQMAAQGTGNTSVSSVNTAINSVEEAVKPYVEKVDLVDQGLTLLDRNDAKSEAQVDRMLATLSGDKALSMAEVNAVANRNGFVGSAAASIERIISGKATPADRASKRKIFEALREVAEKKTNEALAYQNRVLKTTSLSAKQVDEITNRRPKTLIESTLLRKNIPYEPEKYDYRIMPDGTVQRKEKE